ncbi:hypothetical protein OQA88_13353 [Cercophora sp. LCS_1]
MAKKPGEPGIYSATYSGIPVYEFQFGADLKEHVMRRRHDDWINATHILKAAGFDKPARTRILEREVQKGVHEKIQGGYGKYQGTWIPLDIGRKLAEDNRVLDRLLPIFDYRPGNESPPPAPRHTSKPKAPKARPAVPKWNSKSTKNNTASQGSSISQAHQGVPVQEEYEGGDAHMHEDDTPDNLTVASASYMGDEDGYDMSQFSGTGHRKRKREEVVQDLTEQTHALYGDELLDYFLLSRNEQPALCPDPPTNFQPNWPIDTERHTALHWAAAMGDVEVIKQLKRFGADLSSRNVRGETPLMRAVNFTNCYEKQTFPDVLKELFSTVDTKDATGCTVVHHAAVMKSGRYSNQSCSRYYLDNILNKLQESHHPTFIQNLLDAQDQDGNTAIHLAAQQDARKCIRALLGRGALTNIPNNDGVRAEVLIKELNESKSKAARAVPQRSSSPFAPDSQRHNPFRDAEAGSMTYTSEAANMVQARMMSLVVQKFNDLARSYDEEVKEREESEREARRILINTQADLANMRTQISDYESRIEADEAAAKTEADAEAMRQKVLAYVTHQNRLVVQSEIARLANGNDNIQNGGDSPEERLQLAGELQHVLQEQRILEGEYVESRSMLGTGDRIDKYRHLLRSCLPPEDQGLLDENLEDMIRMMEDEAEVMENALDDKMEIAAL